MNDELRALCAADQAERAEHPRYGTAEYAALRKRDHARRERVQALLAAGEVESAEDYYHAALIYQHGDQVEEAAQAYLLAAKGAALGYRPARWLAAAAYDRWQMYQGLPQKYGTQFVPDGNRYRLWDVDPATTDAERAAWDVPSLAEQERRAAEVEGRAALVRRLGLTDLALFTEARYTRHPSQADRFTPFQEHPSSLEHFPSGSLAAPPPRD